MPHKRRMPLGGDQRHSEKGIVVATNEDNQMLPEPHQFSKPIKLIGIFDKDSKTAVVVLAGEVSNG